MFWCPCVCVCVHECPSLHLVYFSSNHKQAEIRVSRHAERKERIHFWDSARGRAGRNHMQHPKVLATKRAVSMNIPCVQTLTTQHTAGTHTSVWGMHRLDFFLDDTFSVLLLKAYWPISVRIPEFFSSYNKLIYMKNYNSHQIENVHFVTSISDNRPYK